MLYDEQKKGRKEACSHGGEVGTACVLLGGRLAPVVAIFATQLQVRFQSSWQCQDLSPTTTVLALFRLGLDWVRVGGVYICVWLLARGWLVSCLAAVSLRWSNS